MRAVSLLVRTRASPSKPRWSASERSSFGVFRENLPRQQVEDWLQWWREHPNEVPEGFDATIPVEGLVVIGRNKNLTQQERRRLLHLNSTRDVKLITYDELLEKLETLIQNLELLE